MQESPYELGLLMIGLTMLIAAWLPQMLAGRPMTMPMIFIAGGAIITALPFNLQVPHPVEYQQLWEKLSELAVLASLFAAGLKIDTRFSPRAWRITWRLLAFAMPLTIAAVAVLGTALAGLALPAALLLGAALAPTDPVMASDVQVGPPMSGREDTVRFSLTSEAGLNDGLAFPFTYLAISVALIYSGKLDAVEGLSDWLWRDLIYRVVAGFAAGIAAGWVLGKIIFRYPASAPLAHEGVGYIALSIVLISYGVSEIIGGYGFIATFMAGYVVRRVEYEHEYHTALFDFAENTERMLMAILLVLIGGAAWTVLQALTWEMVALALLVIFVVRPAAGFISLYGLQRPWADKAVIAFFGIRGIGSFYYTAYGLGAAQFAQAEALWAIVTLTVILSATIHGFSAAPIMSWRDRRLHIVSAGNASRERVSA